MAVAPLASEMDLTGQITITGFRPVFTGNYSCVYRGTWNQNPVAVKVIMAAGNKPDSVKRKVMRERAVWSAVKHRNIHPLYGFADDEDFSPFGALISPWCGNGDASQFLNQNGGHMVMAARIDLWRGVIAGVAYLHECTPCIIHGDLKPGNILIDDLGVPRICDFGLARVFLEEGSTGMTTTSEHTGTTRYLAPELVSSEDTVFPTTASDVYAVGCLGLEFIFLQKPYANRANNLRGQIIRDLKAGVAPAAMRPQQGWPSRRAWDLILELWKPNPLHRPSIFTAAYLLPSSKFTLPEDAVQRIINFVATEYSPVDSRMISGLQWIRRTQVLSNLCLVSRACWGYVTPILYRNIRLYLRRIPARLPQLIYAVDNSAARALPFSAVGPSGYARFTEMLLIGIPSALPQSPYLEVLSKDIRTLLSKLTELRVVLIRRAPDREPRLRSNIHSLTTLEIQRVSISLLLDQEPILQALSCLQRLYLRECFPRSSGRHEPRLSSQLYLPELQSITVSGGSRDTVEVVNDLLQALSRWIMPRLKYPQLNLTWASGQLMFTTNRQTLNDPNIVFGRTRQIPKRQYITPAGNNVLAHQWYASSEARG